MADHDTQRSDDDDDWWKSVDKRDADSSQDQEDSEPIDDEPLKRGGKKGKRSRGADDSQDSDDKKDNGKDSRDGKDTDGSDDSNDNKGDSTNDAGRCCVTMTASKISSAGSSITLEAMLSSRWTEERLPGFCRCCSKARQPPYHPKRSVSQASCSSFATWKAALLSTVAQRSRCGDALCS